MNRINEVCSDDILDKLDAAYRAEFELWMIRRVRADEVKAKHDKYEIVRRKRRSSGELYYDDWTCDAPIKLTRAEAESYTDAEGWLNTYRGRAAMRAALETIK